MLVLLRGDTLTSLIAIRAAQDFMVKIVDKDGVRELSLDGADVMDVGA